MARKSLEKPAYYVNREISWLAFNGRVLEEAEDERNPLLERVKFLAIAASNLDEFFEIQVAALLQRIEEGNNDAGPDGLTPRQVLQNISRETHASLEAQYRTWNKRLLPALAAGGIRILELDDLSDAQRKFVEQYCASEVDPLLTPVTVDPAHPFPRVINKALCVAFLLRRRRPRGSGTYIGVITVPRVLPRVVRLPASNGTDDYIFLADIVLAHAEKMYRGFEIISAAAFRLTRNSNLYLQEEESRNLLETVHSELANRRKGDAVRLEIQADAAPEIVDRLRGTFELDDWQVFHTDGPVNLSRVMNIYEQTNRAEYKYKSYVPKELNLTGKSADLFEELRSHNVLLHHPFDSYDAVVKFIQAAADDPRVRSIKQTLYRTSEDSPIIRALIEAAQKKEVTVVVEVKARFDEASNIRWARNLEDAGVQVFHGLVGLKTHCKISLLVRHDPDGVTRSYAHLGTGNYNPVTSRFYTDLSLITADQEITAAAHNVFNYLTAYAEGKHYEPLLVSPLDLASRCAKLVQRETDHARAGKPARIIAKMNALTDPVLIEALYRASKAGVEIDLIVRGMCALRAGVTGVSDRIRVRSVVGRFLEHSRIFYFANGGQEDIYIGSADWMPRNLYDRVEVMVPLRSEPIRRRVRDEILEAYLRDNCKARVMMPDGSYVRSSPIGKKRPAGPAPFSAQDFLVDLAEGKQTIDALKQAPSLPLVKTVKKATA
ncbi:MAG: polyphosphate kinase 1 [Terriglobales bacterium]